MADVVIVHVFECALFATFYWDLDVVFALVFVAVLVVVVVAVVVGVVIVVLVDNGVGVQVVGVPTFFVGIVILDLVSTKLLKTAQKGHTHVLERIIF